jgi:predicted transcriptional regulator
MPNLHRVVPAARQMIYADASLMERLRAYAAATRQSQNKVLVRALAEFLARA